MVVSKCRMNLLSVTASCSFYYSSNLVVCTEATRNFKNWSARSVQLLHLECLQMYCISCFRLQKQVRTRFGWLVRFGWSSVSSTLPSGGTREVQLTALSGRQVTIFR